MKKNIRYFLTYNKYTRLIRVTAGNYLNYFKKVLIILLISSIILIIGIRSLKPALYNKLYHQLVFKVLALVNFDNIKYNKINITGYNKTNKEDIEKIVNEVIKKSSNLPNISFSDNKLNYENLIYELKQRIKSELPWIDKVLIIRSLTNNSLNITVSEYIPFAIWKSDDKNYVIDKDGNAVLVEDITPYSHLVILSGPKANENVKSLFNILAINPALNTNIYSANWVGGRRWDIRFSDGLIVKLPESNISKAWQKLVKIYSMPGSLVGLNMIDLRIEGKIYLEYKDQVIKEIQSL